MLFRIIYYSTKITNQYFVIDSSIMIVVDNSSGFLNDYTIKLLYYIWFHSLILFIYFLRKKIIFKNSYAKEKKK